MLRSTTLAAVLLVGTAPVLAPAIAQEAAPPAEAQAAPAVTKAAVSIIEESDGGTRIDLAGKLRMLSQRVPAALCAIEAGVAEETASTRLAGAVAEFDTILDALSDGNPGRGVMEAETNPRILRGIARIEEIWAPMRDYARQAETLGVLSVDVAAMQERSHTLLTRAKDLVVVVTAQYANPAQLDQANALTIDIAGRQRMLAQRMSKDACLLASGHSANSLAQDLRRTMETYDVSLRALTDGSRQLGIVPPPSPGIATGLGEIGAQWSVISVELGRLHAGSQLDPETRTMLFDGLDQLTARMNAVVGQYAEASNQGS